MKIACVKKLYEALKFARETDEEMRKKLKSNIFKAYSKLQKGEVDEAKDILECVYNAMGEGSPSLVHTLSSCIERIANWEVNATERGVEAEYVIGSEFGEHCMYFSERYVSGDCGLCGGIIFHGTPSHGWMENGSVSIDPSCGWQIHT